MTKTALITGAVGGIGKALCSEFTEKGYRVLATDKVNDPGVVCDAFLQADLVGICHSEKELEKTLSEVRCWLGESGLNVLINNAALQVLGPVDSIALSDWSASMDVNVTAPFLLVQGLLSELEEAGGSVVNIASVHAKMTKPRFATYATSKAALVGLTRALAVDLGGRVRINAINPAAVETNMLLEGFEGRSDLYDELKRMHPIKRIASPEEIAQVAAFLASDQASFITGGVLDVDGGILSRLHDPG
jgi:NAD(P)-dependent dehydrogenase (short-subunit alcohol dehydrogenase family)